MKENNQFTAGMYLLETLTSGMYNDPLSIYREYIQNAVDSIDLLEAGGKDVTINIELDPFERTISIHDNACGIPADNAEAVLSSIGSSKKVGTNQRGFRGIGRLGGIAFGKKAIFETKAAGDTFESIQEWNCEHLRELLTTGSPLMTLEDMFKKITKFRHVKSNHHINNSFFKVTLAGVESFRNQLFDISKIQNYLSQVSPVPLDNEQFSFAKKIKEYLSKNLSHYEEYCVLINGDPVYKTYKDAIMITGKGKRDQITDIEFKEIKVNGTPVAYGWLGIRRDLLGSIRKGEGSSGIRVRVGNIMIGESHLLDKCFRESRFNSYAIGEIHINSPELIPNSRRDDFIDNKMKNFFYNAIEKEIGLPLSKEIRRRSSKNTKTSQAIAKTDEDDGKIEAIGTTGEKHIKSIKPSISAPENESNLLTMLLTHCSKNGCKTFEAFLSDSQLN